MFSRQRRQNLIVFLHSRAVVLNLFELEAQLASKKVWRRAKN